MSTTSEVRLKRFLHYASEGPVYEPGDRFTNESYTVECLSAVEALVAEGKQKEITNIILKAFSSGYSVFSEAIIFALAVSARQTTSEELRTATYKAARTICKTSEDLLLFVRFVSNLTPGNGKGIGHGLKCLLNDWYNKKDPVELAKAIIECPSKYGWSHKDLIKLSHITSKDIATQAVFKFLRRGLAEMKLEYVQKPEAQKVVSYLQMIHDFKLTDAKEYESAAHMIESQNLSMCHVTSVMSTSKVIWAALVPRLPLSFLLHSINRLGHMRFLNPSHPVATLVEQALTNQESIAKSGLHPVDVLIAVHSYEKITLKKPGAVPRTPQHTKPANQPTIIINPKIVEALNQLMVSTFKLLVPTGQRYMVVIDVRTEMEKTSCYRNNCTTSLMAASLLALSLVKTERSATIGTFSNSGTIHTVRIGKNATLKDTYDKLVAVESCPVDLSQPINHAKNKAKEYDVFLMITDNQLQQLNLMSPAKAIHQYRKKMKILNAKVVVCGLCCNKPFGIASSDDSGMLEILGFDGNVPRIIEAFSRGAF